MKIAIACDHAAINFKNAIKQHLEKNGHTVLDEGAFTTDAVDYPDFAEKACQRVISKSAELGIIICGTGIGMSMAANKIKGIRCAHCSDTYSAKLTRLHNDANVLAIGERVLGLGLALDIVDAFVNTEFSNEERHIKRINKIHNLEK